MFTSKVSKISVQTNPEEAIISVYANSGGKIFEGKTPCVISLNKKEVVDGKVIVTKKGFKEVQINLGRTIEPWGLANGCFFLVPGFVIGGGIDYLNGNLVKPDVDNINIFLEPDSRVFNPDSEKFETAVARRVYIDVQKSPDEYLLFISED